MSRPAAFLDRDGVLIEAVVCDGHAVAPTQLSEFRIVPGAREQVRRLKEAGLLCCVVTNQPEVARGRVDSSTLEAMHAALGAEVPVDDIFVCVHEAVDHCACRKPLPGLLIRAAARWAVDLSASVMIGDRWSDVAAGRAAGSRTVLLDRRYSTWSSSDSAARTTLECAAVDAHAQTLAAAVDAALALAGAAEL
jgi:D-glycero-D-manno-heptose 1,7-bisphosphate phosphatase